MYLLRTRDATLHRFATPESVRYAIVSHTWLTVPPEQSFTEIEALASSCGSDGTTPRSRCSAKVQALCALAERAGYEWIWLDTCCVDERSSAEHSEAINSMFAWYAVADVCYAYLCDVGDDEDPSLPGSAFRRSRWFTRGWTLQELIAPGRVIFLSRSWNTLGSKHMLATVIEEVTGIDRDVLTHTRSLNSVSVARRMSWASRRETRRVEDVAYCLMGLFGVSMPTIYGEGPNSFIRLQQEILKRIPDQSIFAWGPLDEAMRSFPYPYTGGRWLKSAAAEQQFFTSASCMELTDTIGVMLASSPSAFVNSSQFQPLEMGQLTSILNIPETLTPKYSFTSHGLRLHLPLSAFVTPSSSRTTLVFAPLACTRSDGRLMVLLLQAGVASDTYNVGQLVADEQRRFQPHYYRGSLISPNDMDFLMSLHKRLRSIPKRIVFNIQEVCVPYCNEPGTVQKRYGPLPETLPMSNASPAYSFFVPPWELARLRREHGLLPAPACDGMVSVGDHMAWVAESSQEDIHTQGRVSKLSRLAFIDPRRGEDLVIAFILDKKMRSLGYHRANIVAWPRGRVEGSVLEVHIAKTARTHRTRLSLENPEPDASPNDCVVITQSPVDGALDNLDPAQELSVGFEGIDRLIELRFQRWEGLWPSARSDYIVRIDLSGEFYHTDFRPQVPQSLRQIEVGDTESDAQSIETILPSRPRGQAAQVVLAGTRRTRGARFGEVRNTSATTGYSEHATFLVQGNICSTPKEVHLWCRINGVGNGISRWRT